MTFVLLVITHKEQLNRVTMLRWEDSEFVKTPQSLFIVPRTLTLRFIYLYVWLNEIYFMNNLETNRSLTKGQGLKKDLPLKPNNSLAK